MHDNETLANRRALSRTAAMVFCVLLPHCSPPPPPAPATPTSPRARQTPPAEEALPRRWPTLSSENAAYDVGAFPQIATDLADDARRATVVALCTPCHSARYITAQPPLSTAIWEAEVTKMVEGFGAVVPEDKRADVIGYLTDHYGPSRGETAPVAPAPSQAEANVYKTYCTACHGADGQGVPGAFPPLARHASTLAQTAAGRSYMMHVVLHGVVGPIAVDGVSYNNMMPPLGNRLTDAEVAAVLNQVRRTWPAENQPFVAVDPVDVASHRAKEQSPQQVYQSRPGAASGSQ